MSDDRRHFARVAFAGAARLSSAGEPLDVKVLDLSFKGALVDAPKALALAVGSACILNIALAGDAAAITMTCEVSHIEGEHVGLLCRSIDLDSMTHLRQLIQLNLGDASLLDREFRALVSR